MTLDNHFPSKEDLVAAVLNARHRRFLDRIDRAVAAAELGRATTALLDARLRGTRARRRISRQFRCGLHDPDRLLSGAKRADHGAALGAWTGVPVARRVGRSGRRLAGRRLADHPAGLRHDVWRRRGGRAGDRLPVALAGRRAQRRRGGRHGLSAARPGRRHALMRPKGLPAAAGQKGKDPVVETPYLREGAAPSRKTIDSSRKELDRVQTATRPHRPVRP